MGIYVHSLRKASLRPYELTRQYMIAANICAMNVHGFTAHSGLNTPIKPNTCVQNHLRLYEQAKCLGPAN